MNRVISFASPVSRKVRGTNVRKGQTIYAIQDTHTGLFWIWCYTDRAYAKRIANRVHPDGPTDIAANWRFSRLQLSATDRTED